MKEKSNSKLQQKSIKSYQRFDRTNSVTTEDIIFKYEKCSTNIECLDWEHKPVVNKTKRILLSLTDKVKEELQIMKGLNKVDKSLLRELAAWS